MIDDRITDEDIPLLINETDLGENSIVLLDLVKSRGKGNVFVELGVDPGISSRIFLHNAIKQNNYVHGFDVTDCSRHAVLNHPCYDFWQLDSIKGAAAWYALRKADIVFVDSLHVKEHVLLEIEAWWPRIKLGGYMIFHDTHWKGYVHRAYHDTPGQKPGSSHNGYDSYGGIDWETPDKAVLEIFRIPALNYSDKFIEVVNYPNHMGMTMVKKLEDTIYPVPNRDVVVARQKHLINSIPWIGGE